MLVWRQKENMKWETQCNLRNTVSMYFLGSKSLLRSTNTQDLCLFWVLLDHLGQVIYSLCALIFSWRQYTDLCVKGYWSVVMKLCCIWSYLLDHHCSFPQDKPEEKLNINTVIQLPMTLLRKKAFLIQRCCSLIHQTAEVKL